MHTEEISGKNNSKRNGFLKVGKVRFPVIPGEAEIPYLQNRHPRRVPFENFKVERPRERSGSKKSGHQKGEEFFRFSFEKWFFSSVPSMASVVRLTVQTAPMDSR